MSAGEPSATLGVIIAWSHTDKPLAWTEHRPGLLPAKITPSTNCRRILLRLLHGYSKTNTTLLKGSCGRQITSKCSKLQWRWPFVLKCAKPYKVKLLYESHKRGIYNASHANGLGPTGIATLYHQPLLDLFLIRRKRSIVSFIRQ